MIEVSPTHGIGEDDDAIALGSRTEPLEHEFGINVFRSCGCVVATDPAQGFLQIGVIEASLGLPSLRDPVRPQHALVVKAPRDHTRVLRSR
jgi:hypothetical protein